MSQQLLNIKQNLDANLGSNQLIDILDQLIEKCFDVLMTDHSEHVTEWLCAMAHKIAISGEKRSYSTDTENNSLVAMVVNAAANTLPKNIMSCHFDRTFPLTFIDNTIKQLAKNNDWPSKRAATALEYYYEAARLFISHIAEKYYRLSFLRTEAMIRSTALSISRDDLWANNNLMIVTAILKYSSNKGTLTNFIQLWMGANSNARFSHETNLAYSIPPNKRRVMQNNEWEDNGIAVVNLAHNIDDASNVTTDLSGNIELDDSKDRRETLYAAAASLLPDPDVIFYMQANAIPYRPQPMLGVKINEDIEDHVREVEMALDFSEVINVPPPSKRKIQRI